MYTEKFKAAYYESRNGSDVMVRHALSRRFTYSVGVAECADAGCYWLVDILATELPPAFAERPGEYMCIVRVVVSDGAAEITGEFRDDDPNPYRRGVAYTDLPDGTWTFYVQWDGDYFFCILPTEY